MVESVKAVWTFLVVLCLSPIILLSLVWGWFLLFGGDDPLGLKSLFEE